MRTIIEKILLSMLSYAALLLLDRGQNSVAFLLLSLILSFLLELFQQKRLQVGILLAHALLFLLKPEALFFFPLFVYSAIQIIPNWSWLCLFVLFFLPTPLTILFSFLAAYMAYQRQADQAFRKQNLQIQDRLAQDKMTLRRKQQQLEQD